MAISGVELLVLSPGVSMTRDPGVEPVPTVTLWSGASAFRTRWTIDRRNPAWTVDDGPATRDDGGDVFRFDSTSGRLREAWLARPSAVRVNGALHDAIARCPTTRGSLSIACEVPLGALPNGGYALYDITLGCYVALRAGDFDGLSAESPFRAIAVSPEVALVFVGGRYVGWRVTDPVSCVRPMGWPEPRDGAIPSGVLRERLVSLLYDWMTLDAAPKVRPYEALDAEDIAHLVSVRDRARELAMVATEDGDPTAGVGRDVAAQIHWGWGFYRVPETVGDR